MRRALPGWMLIVAAQIPAWTLADDIRAGPATDLSVTVYRAPDREAASINLDELRGFALVSEKRMISIPAGISRVRFGGVADVHDQAEFCRLAFGLGTL